MQRPKRDEEADDDEGPAAGVEGDLERPEETLVTLGVRGPLKCGQVSVISYVPEGTGYRVTRQVGP